MVRSGIFYTSMVMLLLSRGDVVGAIIVTNETMKNCAQVTRRSEDFKNCCLNHSFANGDSPDEILDIPDGTNDDPGANSGESKTILSGGGQKSEIYNKNDAISNASLFNYTHTYAKKQCTDIGYYNSSDWCVCHNGGSFRDGHCWCPMGSWHKDGKCICQSGTIKYEFDTGPANSVKTFNCQDDGYVNPYTFSDSDDYAYAGHNVHLDPDMVDWSDPLDVFWYNYEKSGQEVGMTFGQAFDMQNERNQVGKYNTKIKIWKVFGIVARNGTTDHTIDVVGDAKCITPDANLDADGGKECVCGIKSVSLGRVDEK